MKTLYEGILDSDSKVIQKSEKTVLEENVKAFFNYCSRNAKFGDDYLVDDNNMVHVIGRVSNIEIDKNFNKKFKFAEIEPTMICKILVKDIEQAKYALPSIQIGNPTYKNIILIYDVKEDIIPADLPLFVAGDIKFIKGKNLNLCIMPNCNGGIKISEKGFSKVIYPAGFPSSVNVIEINK